MIHSEGEMFSLLQEVLNEAYFHSRYFLAYINKVIILRSNIFFWHYWPSASLTQYLTHSVHGPCVKHLLKGVDEHLCTSNMKRYLSPQNGYIFINTEDQWQVRPFSGKAQMKDTVDDIVIYESFCYLDN